MPTDLDADLHQEFTQGLIDITVDDQRDVAIFRLCNQKRLQCPYLIESFEVVGEAGTGIDTIRLANEKDFDVLLLDINMPGVTGPAVAEEAGITRCSRTISPPGPSTSP